MASIVSLVHVQRRTGRAAPVAPAVLVAVVVLGDQLTKAWAWRHVDRVSIDTGGGVLDTFLGGVANRVMADPFVGAVVDIGVAAALGWIAWRVFSRARSWPLTLAVTVALAAATSNLLDRLGLHRVTAPGSTRGVVNWISLGGGETSPMNGADLLILAAGVALGAIALTRFVRRHPMLGRQRELLVAAAVVVTAVSLAGAVHSGDGTRGRPEGRSAPTVADTADPAPPLVQRGAPAAAARPQSLTDDLEGIATQGKRVTVTWTSESVTVTGRSVLGWRTDGVSTLYLHAVVVGPTSVELYLPAVGSRDASAGLCRWRSVPPGPDSPAGSPAIWECDTGQAPLTMAKAPVLFP